MADDIVTRLREMATDRARYSTHYDGCDQWHIECAALHACDEIERLRSALALAVGELSTVAGYKLHSPEALMNQFLDEARSEC